MFGSLPNPVSLKERKKTRLNLISNIEFLETYLIKHCYSCSKVTHIYGMTIYDNFSNLIYNIILKTSLCKQIFMCRYYVTT